ncbi:MAG: low molecular weight phosphotyrosine protein phosphatase [Eubacterium sp.]|nr:low molecular weight phosphotyrosine protein phosphatase [Eubacterium sp.]
MTRIMFVCHGNICRSPMAEFVMKKLVSDRGMDEDFYIASAATHTDEIWAGKGNPIYPPAQRELIKNKIPFDDGKRATLLTKADADKYDLFIGMDGENIRYMHRILGDSAKRKICKLLDFTNCNDVSDPWYTGNFALAFSDIRSGCEALLNEL